MNSLDQDGLETESVTTSRCQQESHRSRNVRVEVSGFDVRGRYFTEHTVTLDVSEAGCRFRLDAELETHSAIAVRVTRRGNGFLLPDPPVLFRVVWTRPTQPGWMVAGAKLQPVNLWTVGFPAEPGDEHRPDDSSDSLDDASDEPPAA